MKPEHRRRVNQRQRDLLGAIVLGAPTPTGFDRARLQITSRQLVEKRWHNIGKVRPALARSLADDPHTFFIYAATHARPAGGARADAFHFVQHTLHHTDIGREALVEHALAHARYRIRRGRLTPRHAPFLAIVRGGRTRLAVAIHLPLVGERVLSPVGRSRTSVVRASRHSSCSAD